MSLELHFARAFIYLVYASTRSSGSHRCRRISGCATEQVTVLFNESMPGEPSGGDQKSGPTQLQYIEHGSYKVHKARS